MDPLTMSLLAIPALAQAGIGIGQLSRARKYADVQRPQYTVPESMVRMQDIAETLASQRRLPGQDVIEENLREGTGTGTRMAQEASSTPTQVTDVITRLFANEQSQRANLGVEADRMYQRNQANLMNVLGSIAPYQEKEFEMNEFLPYMQSMNTARALRESGMRNLFSGISDMSGIGTYTSSLGSLGQAGSNGAGMDMDMMNNILESILQDNVGSDINYDNINDINFS